MESREIFISQFSIIALTAQQNNLSWGKHRYLPLRAISIGFSYFLLFSPEVSIDGNRNETIPYSIVKCCVVNFLRNSKMRAKALINKDVEPKCIIKSNNTEKYLVTNLQIRWVIHIIDLIVLIS